MGAAQCTICTEPPNEVVTPSLSKFNHKHFVNLNLFQNINHEEKCQGQLGTKCKSIQRIMGLLDYHSVMLHAPKHKKSRTSNVDDVFLDFCDRYYPMTDLLRDYIHFLCHHSDFESRTEIASKLQDQCPRVGTCTGSQRHFRDRRDVDGQYSAKELQFEVEIADTLHFNICHLEETGLRIDMKAIRDEIDKMKEDERDENVLVDAVMKRMAQEIKEKKKNALFLSERYDGNTKFNISANCMYH